MSDSFQPHESQQASLSITNTRSSLRLTYIESVMPSSHLILCRPLLLLPPIPPSIRVFPMSELFAWGVQSTGVSALASFLPKKSQGWSPSEWTGWISWQSTYYPTIPEVLIRLECRYWQRQQFSVGFGSNWEPNPTCPLLVLSLMVDWIQFLETIEMVFLFPWHKGPFHLQTKAEH